MTGRNCPLREAADRWPHLPGLLTALGTWTFAEWEDEVCLRTDALRNWGWHAQDRIGLEDAGSAEFIFWLLAAIRSDLVACITSPRWLQRQREQAATCTGWRGWRAASEPPDASLAPLTPQLQTTDECHLNHVPGLATILFSSGSSGTPKAIAHRLASHRTSAAGACDNLPLGPGDRWPLSLPMSHVSGLGILFRCLHGGASLILPGAGTPLESQLDRWNPTHLSLVPTQLKRLLDHGQPCPSQLRGVLVGGAAIPHGLIARAIDAKWPVVTTYGLTEMASQVTATKPGASLEELATCGRLLEGRELKFSSRGEILVRGSTLCAGFVRNAVLHAAADADGWYATGDLGCFDESARLIVSGRLDQMFISGGENCYPEEIENCLLELPGIRQACVVAVPHPEYGQRPFAFVDAAEWTPLRWQATLTGLLPRFKIPDHFAKWPVDMPLKPNRVRLAELARQWISNGGPPKDGA